jgi:hypothetical protein
MERRPGSKFIWSARYSHSSQSKDDLLTHSPFLFSTLHYVLGDKKKEPDGGQCAKISNKEGDSANQTICALASVGSLRLTVPSCGHFCPVIHAPQLLPIGHLPCSLPSNSATLPVPSPSLLPPLEAVRITCLPC